MSKPGFIYLLGCGNGLFKIGRATNLANRISSLSAAFPFEYRVAAVIYSPDAASHEAEIHAQFSSKRFRGEWFRLTDDDVAQMRMVSYYSAYSAPREAHHQIEDFRRTGHLDDGDMFRDHLRDVPRGTDSTVSTAK